MVALWPNNQINHWLAAHDFFTLGLCHTSSHTDFQIRVRNLKRLHAAQFGIHLFRSLFADVACVEQDHICVFGRFGFNITLPAQRLGHAFTVIDVHLTSICFNI